jgi:hypothetical protein
MPQVGVRVAKPLSLGGEAQNGLHHRERDQLGIGQLRSDPDRRTPGRQMR